MAEINPDNPANVIFVAHMNHQWCAVIHRTITGKVIYVGFSKISEALSTRDNRRDAEWVKSVNKADDIYSIEIANVFDTKLEAMQYARRIRNELQAPLARSLARKQVRRLHDGKIYDSVTLAARDNLISQGTMSNHLNGRKNYAKIHGMEFEWYYPPKPETITERTEIKPGYWLIQDGAYWRLIEPDGSQTPFNTKSEAMIHFHAWIGA